jgi:MarR family transcriptional repressor of emrRAB
MTPAGKRLVLKMVLPLFPRLEAMFSGFSDTDKKNLGRLLRKLAHNLDQATGHPETNVGTMKATK